MNDSADLRQILKNWPYDPEDDARIIRGDDSRELMQVRTLLGIEQYEMDGRPDGERPGRCRPAQLSAGPVVNRRPPDPERF